MTRQFADVGRGVNLAYEQLGDKNSPALVLVAGFGQQLHHWPDGLCRMLVKQGYQLIRFDNRDAGESTHFDFPPPGALQFLRKRWHPEQYDLGDMAADAVGLFDALGFGCAHVVGMSMGGMIAQTIAARYPNRVASLTSIMSTTGAPRVGRPAWSTWPLIAVPPAKTREKFVAQSVRLDRQVASHGYPFDEPAIRAAAETTWDRDPDAPAASGRQLAAIFKSGDRTGEVRAITAPTLVLHGDRDLMVDPSGGAITAQSIPGARLHTIQGMGHDLPTALWPTLADLIHDHSQNWRHTV
ncbi:alpha/beta fold hydrolase [Nocardia pseudovaccinii]|uniref:alpha/beta fold hydrolase n=1 Tax=Nocardia pseudovaccinii TaxID=189540 RepID=UPI0007A4DF71|nr:alpha/beta fold hydrolase [Nocardia pseudovaccinii]